MSTADNKRSITVAIFVVIAIIIFITGIFILGGQQNRFEKTITLQAVFDDVGGLRKGNNVWFSGVKVGIVKDIRFHGASQVLITMRVDQDVQQYIRKDSKVTISSESLIGNRIIVISGGTPQAPTADSGDVLESEMGLSTDDMMATLQKNNENLVAITENVKELSGRILRGEGTLGAILSDQGMAESFKGSIADLQRVSANTARASGALNQFANKLNTEGGLANELLTDTAVFSQLKSSVQQLQQTTTTAASITENLNEASNKLTSSDNSIGILLNDEQVGNQLKNTVGSLETSSDKFDETLDALQYHWFFRGAFRRKAKQEAKE